MHTITDRIKPRLPIPTALIILIVAAAAGLQLLQDERVFGSETGTGLVDTGEGLTKRSSSPIAMTPDGTTLLVVNPDSDSLSLITLDTPVVITEIPVGDDPRTVTVDRAQAFAYVANRLSHTISVVDLTAKVIVAEILTAARPYGVLVSDNGERLYVAEQGADQVSIFDTSSKARLASHPTRDRPSGLALSPDNNRLYITYLYENILGVLPVFPQNRFLPLINYHSAGSQTVTPTAPRSDYTQIPYYSVFGSREIPLFPTSNLLQSILVSADGTLAYLPHTRSNSTNQALTVDSTVFPLVSMVDLSLELHLIGQQFDLATLDPPAVGLPMEAALHAGNSELWVVNSSSNDLTVIDLNTRLRTAHIEVGANPRGIALAPDGSTAYVTNILDGTVSVIDTATYSQTDVITATIIPIDPVLLAGKRLFHSSDDPRLALDHWMSCNSCHFDGEHDGQTWFRAVSGPRNTPGLLGIGHTAPFRWSGEWDELADSEFAIRMDAFGTGLVPGPMNCTTSPPDCTTLPPHAGLSPELDALAAFVNNLTLPMSPDHIRGEPLSPEAQRGQAIFHDPAVGCATCHPPPTYTDGLFHDVGSATPNEQIGPAFNPPSLLGIYDSAPYFHDGRARNLTELLTTATPGQVHDLTGLLTPSEISDLTAFLLALPFE